MKEWKSIGIKILKMIYEINFKLLYNVLIFNNDNLDILIEDEHGDIKIYNKFYKKVSKNA